MWLRGILPKDTLVEDIPYPEQVGLMFVGHAPIQWPIGRCHTDGAGGVHSSTPVLRRCGCGIASISDCPLRMLFGVGFALGGNQQTVPRSELFCNVVIGLLAVPCALLTAVSDSSLVVSGIQRGQKCASIVTCGTGCAA